MIPLPPGVRVLIATGPVDFRKGADSLAGRSGSDATFFEYFKGEGPKPSRTQEGKILSASPNFALF